MAQPISELAANFGDAGLMWRLLFLMLIASSAGVALHLDGGDMFRSHDLDREFRDQFHLADGQAFSAAPKKDSGREPCTEMGVVRAEVQFNAAEYARFKASLTDPDRWKPTPLRHYNTNLADYAFGDDALAWNPIVRRTGGPFSFDPERTRAIQSYSEFNDVKSGMYLCYTIEVGKDTLGGLPEGAGYPDIRVVSCDSPAIASRPVGYEPRAYVLAILDSERQRLKMKINFSHAPQYCAAARTVPLMERYR